MTNYEKIKQMSVEELAEQFEECICSHIQSYNVNYCNGKNDCENCVVDWLQEEAEE